MICNMAFFRIKTPSWVYKWAEYLLELCSLRHSRFDMQQVTFRRCVLLACYCVLDSI